MGKLFIGNKAVGEFDAARVTGQHIQLNNFVSFDTLPQHANQQIVLEWLQRRLSGTCTLTTVLWELLDDALELEYDTAASNAWSRLPRSGQAQVLMAFSQWILEQEEE